YDGVASSELGAAPEAGICPGYGRLSVLPSGVTAHDHHHYPDRGDPQDTLPPEARGRSADNCPGSGSPSNVRLGRLSGLLTLFLCTTNHAKTPAPRPPRGPDVPWPACGQLGRATRPVCRGCGWQILGHTPARPGDPLCPR